MKHLLLASMILLTAVIAVTVTQGQQKAVPATAGRFANAMTADEIKYFTDQGVDPQAFLESQVTYMKNSWIKLRRAAAAEKLPDELLGLSDADNAKVIAAGKQVLGK